MVVGAIPLIQSRLSDLCLILTFYLVDMAYSEVAENIQQK